MHCKPEIIIEHDHYNIARCPTCARIGLYYKNLLIGFNEKDFQVFSRSICKVLFDRVAVTFPNGEQHVVVNTCHQDIQFNFKRDEFDEFQDLLQQAVLLLETKAILNK